MSSNSAEVLEKLLRDNELKWLIDWWLPPGQAIPALLGLLNAATKESRRLLGSSGPEFTVDMLVNESQQNAHKVKAFLQALGDTRKPEMLVMVWRILQGMRIQAIDMSYQERNHFRLRCVLNSPYENKPETYESSDIVDAMLLRHLGIMEMDNGPVFEGFYPLRSG
jgi:hypothetical protein